MLAANRLALRAIIVPAVRQTRFGRNFCFSLGNTESSTQKQRTLQKVQKLISDKNETFVVNTIHQRTLEALTKDDDKLSNFWLDAIVQNPSLLSKDPVRLKQLEELLQTLAAPRYLASRFLALCPNEFFERFEEISHRLEQWSAFCRSKKLPWIDMLCEEPGVLCLDQTCWQDRSQDLREFFSPPGVVRLLKSTPSILLDDWKELKNKIKYLLEVMHVSPEDMARHGVLGLDLEFIQTRYQFLDRCGLYKHPNAKSVGFHERSEPPINIVLLDDTREFLERSTDGRLTMEEYNTFLTVLAEEKENNRYHQSDAYYDEGLEERLEEEEQFRRSYRNSNKKET